MISVEFDREELARIVAEAVRKEMEVIMLLFSDRHLSQGEAMRLLGIKSHSTMRGLVARGKVTPVNNGGKPKYRFSDIINLKNKPL